LADFDEILHEYTPEKKERNGIGKRKRAGGGKGRVGIEDRKELEMHGKA